MCGIAGIASTGRPPGREEIGRMVETLAHRGPDDHGIEVWEDDGRGVSAGFGHTRLSIIDLSRAGHQPMPNEDGLVWITFNGEIFNAPALAERQQARGHRFRSRSDTETIVHEYEDRGLQTPRALRGMFAFAIFDRRDGSLLLARDRLGKKPLYYHLGAREIVFASEIKAILAVRPELGRLSLPVLDLYLSLHYVPGPWTIYEGIQKLPAGSTLHWQGGRATVEPYWDVPTALGQRLAAADAAELLREKLDDAVRTRLLSDVPVGAFLSGGLDSAVLVARMGQLSGQRAHTFTIGFAGTPHDERAPARRVSQVLGTEHHEICIDRIDPDDFCAALRAADEPLADGALCPTYLLAREASHYVKVVLTGEGADEIFGGYPWYRRERLMTWLRPLPGAARLAGSRMLRALDGCAPELLRTVGRHLASDPAESVARWTRVYADYEKPGLYSGEFLRALAPAQHPYVRLAAAVPGGVVRRGQYLDLKVLLADDLLMKVDKTTMAHGLEARSPYLDHHLVEFAMGLPSRLHVGRTTGKQLLRLVAQQVLPQSLASEVASASKRGFTIPTARWLDRDLRELVRDVTDHFSDLPIAPLFSRAAFVGALEAARRGDELATYQGWVLFNLAVWSTIAPACL